MDVVASLARNWWAVAVRGAAAIVFGVLTLVLPGISLAALILLFGAYALVSGVFTVAAALRRAGEEEPWWSLLVDGIVSIGAGLAALALPGLTALVLLYVIGAWAIVTGIFEIAGAVRLRRQITGEWWLLLSGILSVVFGGLVVLAPGAGALALLLWIGVYSVALGALLVALAFRLRRLRADVVRPPLARAA
jgi:uncharacterized membrane protein HdeD (DUF308 family)